MHLALVAAVAILAASISPAEARARFKFRSSAPVAATQPKPAPVAAKPERGGVLPAALLGAAIASRPARARDDVTTSSTAASGAVTPLAPVSASPKPTTQKPAYVCASDRKVGAGSGFCEVN